MSLYKDKVVIVTGAASGFGKNIARSFSDAGAQVVVADIDADGAKATADSLGEAVAVETDVSNVDSVRDMIHTAVKEFSGLDVLVNNAGVPHRSMPMLDLDPADADRMWAVNVRSVFLACKFGIPVMRERPGASVVNVASIGAIRPRGGMTVYNASKSAVITLTRGLAAEVAPDVRVNAVNPAVAETNFVKGAQGLDKIPDNVKVAMLSEIPMGRTAATQDIADAILFLASPAASFITGVALDVDGGRSIQ
ncbi:SDR family oxidoreductase [Rhodococcus opacus]|uniref:SDR family oxidoreductase n=1 Tax=Rhodococcus opacus TaxID=37919 RepID=A0AAX3Y996_RHOOP|nr:SDR family oxidoreductase [Rhodococcus opacus]MCZ4586270.1 SDR family oxidoreductase [Rhodococcus opacus]WLF44731.1 SDR family oxidoreductase [Rhodococcus opacus]